MLKHIEETYRINGFLWKFYLKSETYLKKQIPFLNPKQKKLVNVSFTTVKLSFLL